MRLVLIGSFLLLLSVAQLIAAEGVENMTETDLQAACRERGMRSMGVSAVRLREGLEQWLKLHLREKVPASLLLLTRLMYLPSHVMSDITEEDKLVATLESLPGMDRTVYCPALICSRFGGKLRLAGKLPGSQLTGHILWGCVSQIRPRRRSRSPSSSRKLGMWHRKTCSTLSLSSKS